jgi:hypothetical protein
MPYVDPQHSSYRYPEPSPVRRALDYTHDNPGVVGGGALVAGGLGSLAWSRRSTGKVPGLEERIVNTRAQLGIEDGAATPQPRVPQKDALATARRQIRDGQRLITAMRTDDVAANVAMYGSVPGVRPGRDPEKVLGQAFAKADSGQGFAVQRVGPLEHPMYVARITDNVLPSHTHSETHVVSTGKTTVPVTYTHTEHFADFASNVRGTDEPIYALVRGDGHTVRNLGTSGEALITRTRWQIDSARSGGKWGAVGAAALIGGGALMLVNHLDQRVGPGSRDRGPGDSR